MVLKVWQKTIAALSVITVGAGSALAGTYFYANSKHGKGYGHHSSRSMENNLNLLKEVKKYDLNLMDPNSPNKVLAKFDFEKNQIEHQDADQWILEYQQKNKKSPIFNVEAGPARFQNYAPELVRPKDYVQFVTWFSKNISWGADLSSLSFFRIVRGAIIDNGTVTLGSFKVDKFATKRINFSPEAFFGMSNSKDFLKIFSKKRYTKKELDKFIEYLNKTNASIKDKSKKLQIYSIEENGGLYLPVLADNSQAINKIDEFNPLLTTKVSNLEPVVDKNGVISLVNKPSFKIKYEAPISNLQIWRGLAGKKWKGVDFEWLKYVTHHEYGHMQTMGMVNDSTNNPVGLGTPNGNSLSKTGSAYDIDELNRYFAARLPNIRALRASIRLRKYKDAQGKTKYGWNFYQDRLKEWKADPKKHRKPNAKDFTSIGFEILNIRKENWDQETIENIFGSTALPGDPNEAPLKVNVEDFLKRIKSGRRPRFFMQSIKDVRELAEKLGINQAALYVMNAIDPMIATISPGFTNYGNKIYAFKDKDKKINKFYTLQSDEVAELLTYFNKKGEFSNLIDRLAKLKGSNGELFLRELITPKKYHKNNYVYMRQNYGGNLFLPTTYTYDKNKGYDWKIYKLNHKAKDKNGNLLMDKIIDPETKKPSFKINKNGLAFYNLINKIVDNSLFHEISGSELINGTVQVGWDGTMPTVEKINKSVINKSVVTNGNWKKWLENPSNRNRGWLNQLFADYTFQFSEVLTRDWVQITQNQEEESHFKYGSRFLDINEKDTGIEMFFDTTKLMNQKVNKVSYKNYFTLSSLVKTYGDLPIQLLETIKLDVGQDEIAKSLYEKMTSTRKFNQLGIQSLFIPSEESAKHWKSLGIDITVWSELKSKKYKEQKKAWKKYDGYKKFFAKQQLPGSWGKMKMTNNGFFVDRWLRKVLGWELYDDKGTPKKYEGKETSFADGKKIKTIPEAYWNFFMKSRGVGLRTLTKIWREPSRDAYAMWGYVPLKYKNKIKYLKFTNVKTNKEMYVPIKTGIDNLFYYKDKQASGKKHYLKDDGFTSWTTKKFVVLGTWYDANVKNGNWKMSFVDENKTKVKIMHNKKELTMLGSNANPKDNKKQITTNNLSSKFAAVLISKNASGEEILKINNEFPT